MCYSSGFFFYITCYCFLFAFVFGSVDFSVNLTTTNIITHQGNTIDLTAYVTKGGPNKTIEVQWLRNGMKIVNTSRLNEEIKRYPPLNSSYVSYVYSRLRIKNMNLFDTGRKILI